MLQFSEWKTQLEKSTSSSFVQHGGAQKKCISSAGEKKCLYLYCHRSGELCKTRKPSNPRVHAVKSQGMF